MDQVVFSSSVSEQQQSLGQKVKHLIENIDDYVPQICNSNDCGEEHSCCPLSSVICAACDQGEQHSFCPRKRHVICKLIMFDFDIVKNSSDPEIEKIVDAAKVLLGEEKITITSPINIRDSLLMLFNELKCLKRKYKSMADCVKDNELRDQIVLLYTHLGCAFDIHWRLMRKGKL